MNISEIELKALKPNFWQKKFIGLKNELFFERS